MKEPSPHSSRLALAGGLAAVIVVGGGGFLVGRATTERPPEIIAPAPAPPPVTKTSDEPSRGILGRADLIALARTAGDPAAAGGDIATVEGRRFVLRLPFGCDGPADAASTAALRWRYDADAGVLRIHVSPTVWSAADWWAAHAPADIEAIEGFWIMRPWTADEDCSRGGGRPVAAGPEPVTLPGQTLAIGQLFSTEGARGGRRDGEAYQAVVRVGEDELDASQGFRLRLSGRIARTADGGPVRCHQPGGPEQRPICLVGAIIDEVAIENPANGQTLATWNVGQRRAGQN